MGVAERLERILGLLEDEVKEDAQRTELVLGLLGDQNRLVSRKAFDEIIRWHIDHHRQVDITKNAEGKTGINVFGTWIGREV